MTSPRELDEHAGAVVLVARCAAHEVELVDWAQRMRALPPGQHEAAADLVVELARMLGVRILVVDRPG